MGVRTDITELKRQEQLIQQYNIALERFSYVASHDLQEPLRKVVTHARLLEQALRDGDDAEVARCLDVLKASGERGRDLVRSLLDFARLKDSSITRVPLTLLDLAREVVARFVDEVAAGKARITIDGDPFEVSADRTLLTQVLHNLIGNAVKYRPPGEPARVRVATAIDPRSRAANIVVADEGIGFDMAHAAKLFEPFQRLVARCDYAGTGIGLSLVKAILDKHGWTIDVHATPGVGARFTIAIPARDVVAPPATTWAHAA